MKAYTQNGMKVSRKIGREAGGWGAWVWFGGINGLATNVRRYIYGTRAQAQRADISDQIGGKNGRIA